MTDYDRALWSEALREKYGIAQPELPPDCGDDEDDQS